MRKLLIVFLFAIALTGLVACGGGGETVIKEYTVSFQLEKGVESDILTQKVRNGGKVTKPEDPTKDGYVFKEWTYDDGSVWRFEVDIVTKDLVLVATWTELSEKPANIKAVLEPFSSKIEWIQVGAKDATYEVYLKLEGTTEFLLLEGDVIVEEGAIDRVIFTPSVAPKGGIYVVKVVDGANEVVSDEIRINGDGSETNPFLVSSVEEVNLVISNKEYEDKHFKQVNDILSSASNMITTDSESLVEFSGVYDGNNHEISFTGSGGLFNIIADGGVVKGLRIIVGTQITAKQTVSRPIGAVANVNFGLIENVHASASLESKHEQGELPVYGEVNKAETTGAAGIVGINKTVGVVRNVRVSGNGVVKAGRGIGGVAAFNHGLIESAVVTATLPAGNQANSGKSSNTYSYGGGIAGYNFGQIKQSVVSGRVFAQSAISAEGDGNEGKNHVFGGIVGYNEGLISETSFARNLNAKEFIDKTRAQELEDAANNLGVASIHGDIYVGGIAGINAGIIEHVYVGGALIGGRDFVGGIAGKTEGTGSIKNSYVFAEIAIKDAAGKKLTTTSAKTTLTTYEIAPSGFEEATTLYKPLHNEVKDRVWTPGDVEFPSLPTFDNEDFLKVGDKFLESGALKWQSGGLTSFNIIEELITIPFGGTAEIQYEINPVDAIDQVVIWTSSNEEVVLVSGTGQLTAVAPGTAIITGKTRDGNLTDTVNVTVEEPIAVTGVNIIEETLSVPVLAEITIDYEVLPIDANNTTTTWTSSNVEVVEIVSPGVIKGLKLGTATITVTTEDGSFTDTVEVTVETYVEIESFVISAGDYELPAVNDSTARPEIEIGTILTFSVTDILPENADLIGWHIEISNSRARLVEGTNNQVEFVLGNGLGSVSVKFYFEDPSVPMQEYRFKTISN